MKLPTITQEQQKAFDTDFAAMQNAFLEIKKAQKIKDKEAYEHATEYLKLIKARIKRIKEMKKELVKPIKDGIKKVEAKFKMMSEPYEEMDTEVREMVNVYLAEEHKKQQEELRKQREEEEKKRKEAEAQAEQNQNRMIEIMQYGFKWDEKTESFKLGDMAISKDDLINDSKAEWDKKVKQAQKLADELKPEVEEKPEEAPLPEIEPERDIEPVAVKKVEHKNRSENGLAATQMVWGWDIEDEAAIPREYFILDETRINKEIKAGKREIPGLKIAQKPKVMIR